jgi:integration host factor subunit beta
VEVPPKHVPYFKPGKELKDLINGAGIEAAPSPAGEPAPDNAGSPG